MIVVIIVSIIIAIIICIVMLNNKTKNSFISRNGSMSPVSGGEYPYDPAIWSTDKIVQTHNCYDYAIGNLKPDQTTTTQPSWPLGPSYSCADMTYGFKGDQKDKVRATTFAERCNPSEYKIALMVAPGITPLKLRSDFHFMRQDSNGLWSHKSGENKPTDLDGSGNKITAPHNADRDLGVYNYADMCGYYCIKRE